MNVGFVETMRGTLKANDGSDSHVEFEVHAHADHLRKFLKDGHTRLRGIMRAAPFAVEVPATGELTIDIPRSLTYLVTFEGPNGEKGSELGMSHSEGSVVEVAAEFTVRL